MAGLSLVAHVVAAWLQDGFHHCDEHFQVVGLAGVRLGLATGAQLPWEFKAQMRPWLQPVLMLLAWSPLRAVGVDNPFVWLFWSRLWGGVLAWAVTWLLVVTVVARWSGWRRGMLYVLVGGIWFLPYFDVRTSSESLAALLFHLMLLLVWRVLDRPDGGGRAALLLGVLGGLTFHARYQAAALAGGVLVYAAWRQRSHAWRVAGMLGGLCVGLTVGFALDVWGYKDWVLAGWNYAFANVVEDRASDFGTSPWWDYPKLMLLTQGPAGPVLLLGLVVLWLRRPGHVISLASVPFVLLHVVVPHKEGRFLFPLVLVGCVALVLMVPGGWVRRAVLTVGADRMRAWGVVVALAWIGVNVVGMGNASLMVHSPRLAALRQVFPRPQWPVVWAGSDPREACGGLRLGTLIHPRARFVEAPNQEAAVTRNVVPEPQWWAVRIHDGVAPPLPRGAPCKRVWRTVLSTPTLERWLGPALALLPRARQRQDVEVFECQTPPPPPAAPPPSPPSSSSSSSPPSSSRPPSSPAPAGK